MKWRSAPVKNKDSAALNHTCHDGHSPPWIRIHGILMSNPRMATQRPTTTISTATLPGVGMLFLLFKY